MSNKGLQAGCNAILKALSHGFNMFQWASVKCLRLRDYVRSVIGCLPSEASSDQEEFTRHCMNFDGICQHLFLSLITNVPIPGAVIISGIRYFIISLSCKLMLCPSPCLLLCADQAFVGLAPA